MGKFGKYGRINMFALELITLISVGNKETINRN